MKKILLFTFLLLINKSLFSQSQNPDMFKPNNNGANMGNEIDYSPSQIAGYASLGVGASFIGYTAFDKSSQIKNPTTFYIIGGAFVVTGIGLLIFGNKEKKEPKYWQGLSYENKKIDENIFLTGFDVKLFHKNENKTLHPNFTF
jgi:hypothetical protein